MAEKNVVKSVLEEGISTEKWVQWKELNKQMEGLVEVSEEDDDHTHRLMMETSDLTLSEAISSGARFAEPVCGDHGEEELQPSSSGLSNSPPALSVDVIRLPPGFQLEPTLQYLTGQISFQQFSEMMETKENVAVQDQSAEVEVPLEEEAQEEEEGEEEEDTWERREEESAVEVVTTYMEEKKKRKRRTRKTDLPKHLQGLMGEVHLKYARGEVEEAIKMCMEVIRLAPQAVLPFQTLGMVFEEMGDMPKSLQYYLIAAYLTRDDAEEWSRLAELSLELNDPQQAIKCYTMAIKHDNQNSTYIWERSRLYEKMGDCKKALEGYQAALDLIPPEDGEKYLEIARSLSRSNFELGERDKAAEIMVQAFKCHPGLITSEDVNLLLELQIPRKQYMQSLEVLVKHCGVVFTLNDGDLWYTDQPVDVDEIRNGTLVPMRCSVSELLPIDLRVKLAVCMIHEKFEKKVIQDVTSPLFEESVEDMGDLYLDVAEAFMDKGFYAEARPILSMLVCSRNYNLAAVWLRYGECLNSLGELDSAVQAFSRVVELAPSHIEARMSLSVLQQQLGKHDEALQALSHSETEESGLSQQEQMLLLHKCHLLYSQQKVDDFFTCCKRLLFQQFNDIYKPSFLKIVFSYKSAKHRLDALREHLQSQGLDISQMRRDASKSGSAGISLDDLWDVYVKMCEVMISMNKRADLLDMTTLAMACPQFCADRRKSKEAEFMCLIACILNKNGQFAYNFIKDIVQKEMNNNQAWNLFNQIILLCSDIRHNRFCLRQMLKRPNHLALAVLNGNNSMISGTYKHALGEYISVFRQTPQDPLINLLIGLDFIHLATQKYAAKRHLLLTQGMAFLNNYLEFRGECQESYYNIGRALHQLGLLYAAVHYYRKALSFPPAIQDEKGRFDLSREIAYNLGLIYQGSGSPEYARQLMYQYCVI